MATVRAQIRLPYLSGVPEDVATNTLYFFTVASPPTVTELDEIATRIGFYWVQVGPWISTVVDRANCTIRMYDLDDAEPRQPLAEYPLSLANANNSLSLPAEVAVCHSFRGIYTSGQEPARRRGRIFLGPLTEDAAASSVGQHARPSSGLITAILAGGDQLATDGTSGGTTWAVYSQAGDTTFTVVEQWVNNEFDTQRRRGVLATQRNQQPVVHT